MATDYRGRIAEVKDRESPYFSCTGVVREVRNGLFTIELPEGSVVFERRELRITRRLAEDYKVRVVKGVDDQRRDAEVDEFDAENMADAVTQATGGDEVARIEVTSASRKAKPTGPTTKPRTEPDTHVANSLESLSYPYTIALPAAYAPLLEKKSKGIYGLNVKKMFGRVYAVVETAEALAKLYSRLDTKRPTRQSRTILEGIRSSLR